MELNDLATYTRPTLTPADLDAVQQRLKKYIHASPTMQSSASLFVLNKNAALSHAIEDLRQKLGYTRLADDPDYIEFKAASAAALEGRNFLRLLELQMQGLVLMERERKALLKNGKG